MAEKGIKRICISSSDLNRSLSFYTDEIGLKLICKGTLNAEKVHDLYGLDSGEAEYAMLSNEEQATLLQLIMFAGTPTKLIREGRPSWDYGYYDVAFRVKNNWKEYDYFTAKGFEYYCQPTRYAADWINLDVLESVLSGPDKLPMALIERLIEPIPKFPGRFSIFTDCAITVENADEADRFYIDVLGLTKTFDQTLPDGLVDDIVGIPNGTHTRMLMYSGENTPITECLEYSLKGRSMRDDAKPSNAGIFSVAYETENIDELILRATENGFNTVRPPVKVKMAPYGKIYQATVSGPSGILVELFQLL